jgi:hypothetical protein
MTLEQKIQYKAERGDLNYHLEGRKEKTTNKSNLSIVVISFCLVGK